MSISTAYIKICKRSFLMEYNYLIIVDTITIKNIDLDLKLNTEEELINKPHEIQICPNSKVLFLFLFNF